jgi:hypothetical protein
MRRLFRSVPALVLLGLSSVALAQEMEPNNSCPQARDAGPVTALRKLTGSLDPENAELRSDVDFFRLTAEPGSRIVVFTPPFEFGLNIGIFDERCALLASGPGPSFTEVLVPESGEVVVAVGDFTDRRLDGSGDLSPGGYRVIAAPKADVGSISGRLIDAVSGQPIPDQGLQLEAYIESDCEVLNVVGRSDEAGNFRFERGALGMALPAATYRLRTGGFFTDFQNARSVRFRALAGEHLDVGEFLLVRRDATCREPD